MLNINLNLLNVCTSTNDIAFNAALNGEVEGTSYLTHIQKKEEEEIKTNGLLRKEIYFYQQLSNPKVINPFGINCQ